jgi:hypothetical protein
MPAKSQSKKQPLIVDLHQLSLKDQGNIEGYIFQFLDGKLYSFLQKTKPKTKQTLVILPVVIIIVGRGLNSPKSTLKSGIPTLRFYTQKYLNLVGLEYVYKEELGSFWIY